MQGDGEESGRSLPIGEQRLCGVTAEIICGKRVGALLSDAAKLPGIFLLAMAEDDDARWRGNRRGKPASEKEGRQGRRAGSYRASLLRPLLRGGQEWRRAAGSCSWSTPRRGRRANAPATARSAHPPAPSNDWRQGWPRSW